MEARCRNAIDYSRDINAKVEQLILNNMELRLCVDKGMMFPRVTSSVNGEETKTMYLSDDFGKAVSDALTPYISPDAHENGDQELDIEDLLTEDWSEFFGLKTTSEDQ